jgi:16S rRNA (uracil1498-N3)-methyltransferase
LLLPRIFITSNQLASSGKQQPEHVEVSQREIHHVRNVLRLSIGDHFIGLDDSGAAIALCSVTAVGDTVVAAEVIGPAPSDSLSNTLATVTLFLALPRPATCDAVIEKCVELGIARVILFHADRTQGRLSTDEAEGRRGRLRRVAEAAAKQSGGTVPHLQFAESLKAGLRETFGSLSGDSRSSHSFCFICIEPELAAAEQKTQQIPLLIDEVALRRSACFPSPSHSPAALETPGQYADTYLIVGPEGGMTSEESAIARAYHFQAVSLGPQTLRVETAAILACGIARLGGLPR